MPISGYSEAELTPRGLTPEEIEDPQLFITDFFSMAHLPQWRDMWWLGLRLVVTGDWKNLPVKEKATFIACYENLGKLIEIVYALEKRKAA